MESFKQTRTPDELAQQVAAADEAYEQRMQHTVALDALWSTVTHQIIAEHIARDADRPDDGPRTPHGL